jgi:DNA-3-methyladenine glycosylase II
VPSSDGEIIQRAIDHLVKRDPVMAELIEQVGPFRLSLEDDYFKALVRSILAQQISTSAARSIHARLVEAVRNDSSMETGIHRLEVEELRQLGISRPKAVYLKDLTAKVLAGELQLHTLSNKSNEEVIEELIRVKGIGKWTAQMFLIFSLGRLDIFPADDLGVRAAIKRLYRKRTLPKPKQLRKYEKLWHPYSSIASWYCWRSFDLK